MIHSESFWVNEQSSGSASPWTAVEYAQAVGFKAPQRVMRRNRGNTKVTRNPEEFLQHTVGIQKWHG